LIIIFGFISTLYIVVHSSVDYIVTMFRKKKSEKGSEKGGSSKFVFLIYVDM